MSDDPNDGDVGVVDAADAPYPPRQVWAAARTLASAIDQIDLDRAEDEIRAAYYGNAEDALIAAAEAGGARRCAYCGRVTSEPVIDPDGDALCPPCVAALSTPAEANTQ